MTGHTPWRDIDHKSETPTLKDHPRDNVYLLIEAEILRRERGGRTDPNFTSRIQDAADIVQELERNGA